MNLVHLSWLSISLLLLVVHTATAIHCSGKERRVGSRCVCQRPYFLWKKKNGLHTDYPCHHQLCGADHFTSKQFTKLTSSLIGKSFTDVAELSSLHYCEFGKCFSTVNVWNEEEFHCRCDKDTYLGESCEYTWDICSSKPCLNGGTCQSSGALADGYQFICHCPSPHVGSLCQDTQDVCQTEPCLNGGVCINFKPKTGEFSFICLCSPGYDGGKCEIDIRHNSVARTQLVVISATIFLVLSLLICCITTSKFRQLEKERLGAVPQHITETQPQLLRRLYRLKDEINRLEAQGGLAQLQEPVPEEKPPNITDNYADQQGFTTRIPANRQAKSTSRYAALTFKAPVVRALKRKLASKPRKRPVHEKRVGRSKWRAPRSRVVPR